MKWISCMHTYIASLSHPHLPHIGYHRELSWALYLYSNFPLAIYFTHSSVYMSVVLSIHLVPFPLFVLKFILYICISIPALEIRSLIPVFEIPFICIIYNIYFSFWRPSLYMTHSRLIHNSTNDLVLFFIFILISAFKMYSLYYILFLCPISSSSMYIFFWLSIFYNYEICYL